jgi:ferrous iron transport protein A
LKTLREIQAGDTVEVARIHGEGALKRRIMDMGITNGTRVSLVKNAPLGDPMELELRGYHLSLRRGDAELVEVV